MPDEGPPFLADCQPEAAFCPFYVVLSSTAHNVEACFFKASKGKSLLARPASQSYVI